MCAKNKGYFIVIDTFVFLPEKKLFFLFVFFLAKKGITKLSLFSVFSKSYRELAGSVRVAM